MTIHWKTLEEHFTFLIQPFSGGKIHFLNFSQKTLKCYHQYPDIDTRFKEFIYNQIQGDLPKELNPQP
jgi:hypothetical protein